jgi:hypothetical protein
MQWQWMGGQWHGSDRVDSGMAVTGWTVAWQWQGGSGMAVTGWTVAWQWQGGSDSGRGRWQWMVVSGGQWQIGQWQWMGGQWHGSGRVAVVE